MSVIKKIIKTIVHHGKRIVSRFRPEYYVKKGKDKLKERKYNEAQNILEKGLRKFPGNKQILLELSNLMIRTQNWEKSIYILERFINSYMRRMPKSQESHDNNHLKTLYTSYVKLGMSYQIIGNVDKANEVYNKSFTLYEQEIKKDPNGYQKLILFDNGESRIEFYKRFQHTETVVITFDSINMVWKNPSFAFNLLIRQNVDIIAVRKRKAKTYQQDLSLNDFLNSVQSLAQTYNDKISYGFSLGAYASLYYASNLNCRILALSPRLSIHPVYGKTKMKGKYKFKHRKTPVYNESISPIIVYDPKNKLDHRYINKGLLPYFPNAKLVRVPYGGHGMGPHLKKMGLLKTFILTVIHEKKVPDYNKDMHRSLRRKSSTYYRVLSDACLKRNKPKWALGLVNQALKLSPEDNLCMRLKIHVLKRIGPISKAIEFANKAMKTASYDRIVRLLLIDLYISNDNLDKANDITQKSIKKFGRTKALSLRENQINGLFKNKSVSMD